MTPTQTAGISGFGMYVPSHRVKLDHWCQWYGQSSEKIQAVVGRSFRMRGPRENVYTMAATAVLRLIEQYDVDPARIRFLALGTESSTDNSAGSVVIKGMLNEILPDYGRNPIGRHCEVPEFKHACLGGIYGIKNAARFLACEPEDTAAIVVSSDVAEYARGSSGEPTQGAGAVAVLLEKKPSILSLHLPWSGTASDYRIVDFRKPMSRVHSEAQRANGQIRDFPVFNGKYSTTCYLDATLKALDDLFRRRGVSAGHYLRDLAAVFMHRPYRKMPESGLAMGYLLALARGDEQDQQSLAELASEAQVSAEEVIKEVTSSPDVRLMVDDRRLMDEAFPKANTLLKALRTHHEFTNLMDKLSFGANTMMDIGNLYTAALPAWMAAGLEQAAHDGTDLAGREILLMGYGSGDAAEAIPASLVPGWEEAAKKIDLARTLEGGLNLAQQEYEDLHDFGLGENLPEPAHAVFFLDRIGDSTEGTFIDQGIEYYSFQS